MQRQYIFEYQMLGTNGRRGLLPSYFASWKDLVACDGEQDGG